MAYKINKSDTGFYILYELDMDGTSIKDISKNINLETNIWRYMFVKTEA
jgi:small subunit ribosomal protein S6